jgi:putative spermidine/putrescine transport system permease protein
VAAVSTARTRRRNQVALRWVVLVVVGVFFFLPLFSMFKYATKIQPQNPHRWDAFKAITTNPQLTAAIRTSLELCALTAAGMLILLLPTMVWVRLKVPRARRIVEFLCLLPLTIPAIVIVVGITNVMSWVNYLVTEGPLSLTFPYIILVLPYCYRALDAGLSSIDVVTLSEAARSLGASWFTVITRIIMPNVTSAILSAAFLAVALVMGEFTFASLLLFDNLQVVIAAIGLSNSPVSVAVSLSALAFVAALLFMLSFVGVRRRRREVM